MEEILKFWFEELTPQQWWIKDSSLDKVIKDRFESIYYKASRGELYTWRSSPEGQLAEIIILDQFSRNIFRNSSESFKFDPVALVLSQNCIFQGNDHKLDPIKRRFIYMPFMHSESLKIHDIAVSLFEKLGNEDALKFEHAHRNIILKFGRYPHRNKILKRKSTKEEIKFLNQPNSSF